MSDGCLLCVVAPSGAGKSSLVNALLAREPALKLSISTTTRAPRVGEVSGREYHFVTRERFAELVAADEFLEHAEVYGNFYGTSRRWIQATRAVGCDVVLEIDWQGAKQVKKLFPDMTYVYILPPSIETLRERLVKRGKDSQEVIERRLAAASEDLKHVHKADYAIINADFELAVADLQAIVHAQRLRASRQIARHAQLFS